MMSEEEKERIIKGITTRIESEYRKHKNIEWPEIAARKIYASFIAYENITELMESEASKLLREGYYCPKYNEPTCDLSKLYELYNGNAELAKKLIKTILRETPLKLNAIKEGLKSEDFEQIYNNAHSIKPTIDILNINKQSAQIREIESLAKDKKDLDHLRKLIESLDKSWSAADKQLCFEIAEKHSGEKHKY